MDEINVASLKTILEDYFKKNLMTVLWSCFLFFGGLIFIIYFASIRFMPDIDITSSVSLLVASAFTAAIILLFLFIASVLPGIIWLLSVQINQSIKPLWQGGKKSSEIVRQMLWFVLPLLLFILEIFFANKWRHDEWHYRPLIGFVILSILGLSFYVWYRTRKFHTVITSIPAWGISAFCFYLSLMVVLFISQDANLGDGAIDIYYFILAIVVIIVSNTLVVLEPKEKKYRLWFFLLSFFAFLYLVVLFSGYNVIPKKVMSIYGFGNIEHVVIVVNDEGRDILKRLGIAEKCENTIKPDYIENVDIRSRLGSTYLLSCKMKENKTLKFTLPSRVVLSWSVIRDESR
jgi:hypothetical protein